MMNQKEFMELLRHNLEKNNDARLKVKFYQSLKSLVLSIQNTEDFKCPSSRFLSESFGVSRDTVEKVYTQLEDEGILYRIKGKGSFVYAKSGQHRQSAQNMQYDLAPESQQLEDLFFDQNLNFFADGIPEIRNFPFKKWYETEKQVLYSAGLSIYMKDNSAGNELLREQIAQLVNLHRHTQVSPEQVLIVNSTQQAVYLCGRVLLPENSQVILEHPYYSNAYHLFKHMHMSLKCIGLDAEGLKIQDAESLENIRAVYVTPSCQYPSGIQMSEQRKRQIIEFAEKKNAYIIEDDYDAFMLKKEKNKAVFASDHYQRTVYIGSFSKYLLPGLRLSYLILPERLVEPFKRYRNYIDGSAPSQHIQVQLAHFMKNGEYAVYLHKMQQIYLKRYQAFIHYFNQYLAFYCELKEHHPSMQIACYFKNLKLAEKLENALVKGAELKGIAITHLSQFYENDPEYGFVLGFSALNDTEIKACMLELTQMISAEIKRVNTK
jgi:GntR family transcriptional regulator/MocR family aminotransferase